MKNRETETEGDYKDNPIYILEAPIPNDNQIEQDKEEQEQDFDLDPNPVVQMKCNSCQRVINEIYFDCDFCTGFTCEGCGTHPIYMQRNLNHACTPCYNIF